MRKFTVVQLDAAWRQIYRAQQYLQSQWPEGPNGGRLVCPHSPALEAFELLSLCRNDIREELIWRGQMKTLASSDKRDEITFLQLV
jgi:hypothetical protein